MKTLKHPLLALAFAGFLFVPFGVVEAQVCDTKTPCPTGKACIKKSPVDAKGTCIESNGKVIPGNAGGKIIPGNTVGSDGKSDGRLVNPLKVDSVEGLLEIVLKAAVRIGTIILVLAFVWVGFLFVAARGNSEKLQSARTAFFWTIVGGLILLGASAIAAVIKSTAESLG